MLSRYVLDLASNLSQELDYLNRSRRSGHDTNTEHAMVGRCSSTLPQVRAGQITVPIPERYPNLVNRGTVHLKVSTFSELTILSAATSSARSMRPRPSGSMTGSWL